MCIDHSYNILNRQNTIIQLQMSICNAICIADMKIIQFVPKHVKILADLLKPEIAAILNIESSHLGVDGLKTIDDICRFKSAIFQYAKQGYIIEGDPYLDRLHMEDGELNWKVRLSIEGFPVKINKVDKIVYLWRKGSDHSITRIGIEENDGTPLYN